MKKLLIAVAVGFLLLAGWGCGKTSEPTTSPTTHSQEAVKAHKVTDAELGQKLKCPVLGDEFTVSKVTPALEYKGRTYYLCCAQCVDDFKANPERYAKPEGEHDHSKHSHQGH